MLRVCACTKKNCVCRRAYKEPHRDCFDCWSGYHHYGKKKEEKSSEKAESA